MLVLAIIVSAIGVVYARQRAPPAVRRADAAAERARDELNFEFGRLQLEQATWAESNRIDQIARDRSAWFPEAADIVVIRR